MHKKRPPRLPAAFDDDFTPDGPISRTASDIAEANYRLCCNEVERLREALARCQGKLRRARAQLKALEKP